jgi:hypothetical protein
VKGFVATAGAAIVSVFANGYLFMLLVGLVHNQWLPVVPTIGYWTATGLVALATGIWGMPGKGKQS